MPASCRDGFYALRAFNVELASIKDGHHIRKRGTAPPDQLTNNDLNLSSSTTLGLQLRMEWWKLAISKIYHDDDDDTDDATVDENSNSADYQHQMHMKLSLSTSCWNSPVVRALYRTHQHCLNTNSDAVGLTRRFLERMIDARHHDLHITQYDTLADVRQYTEDTVGSLLYLTLETLQIRNDDADGVVSAAGMGLGYVTALRSTPYRLANGGEVPIPKDYFRAQFPYEQLIPLYLGERDESNSTVLSMEDSQQLFGAFEHIAVLAQQQFDSVRNEQSSIPSAGRMCLLPMVPAQQYLDKLRCTAAAVPTNSDTTANSNIVGSSMNYNVFDTNIINPSKERLRLFGLLGRSWLTGVI